MKALLWILGVAAVALVAVGSLNHATQLSLDYVFGTTPGFSVFWVALGGAAALLLAGLAGWAIGRSGDASARAKLARELEATYRRLRDAEARLPRPAGAGEATTVVVPAVGALPARSSAAADEARTAVTPAADEGSTVVAPSIGEAATIVASVIGDEAGQEQTGESSPPAGRDAAT